MRYKTNTLSKIEQLEALTNRIQFEINRNFSQNDLLETVELIRSQVEDIRSLISIEDDNFAQQFK